jgi:hypothetical protein
MAILLSNVSNALQKVIMPYIQDNFNKQTILLDQVKRNKGVTFMNDYFYAPIRSSRHSGIANLANDGNTLTSGKSSIGQANVGVKILTGAFDISKLTMDATKTAKGAVENQLTFQASTLASDFAKNVNRQYMEDGIGVLSEVSSTSSATTVLLRAPTASLGDGRSVDHYGTVNGDISPTEYLYAGQIIGIGTAAVGTASIAAVVNGTTITLNSTCPAGGSAAGPIYLVDGSGEGAGTAEITGMRAALSSSTADYAGVSRATHGWTPQVGTVSEALTLSAMEKQYLAAKKYAQVGDRYAIFMNTTLYKKYGDILTAMRRSVNATDLLGGWTGLEFAAGAGKVGVFLDYNTPDGEVLIVNLDTWTIAQVSEMGWMEDINGSLYRRPDKITYQATMAWFTNLMCLAPAANGRLTQKTG